MFNEKSSIWIKFAKIINVVVFAILVSMGLLEFYDVNIATHYGSGYDAMELFVIRAISLKWFVVAFVQLSVSMLFLNLVSNVQTIRERLEQSDNK